MLQKLAVSLTSGVA